MMKTSMSKRVLVDFGIALVLLIGVGFLSNYHIKKLAQDTQWVDHTYNVLLQLKDLFADVKTGARTFMITGDERDLEPYRLAMVDIPHPMGQVRQLTKDNPIQQKRLDILEPLMAEKFSITNQLITLKRKGAPDDLHLIDRSRDIMDKIRALEHDLEDEEYQLLKRRYIKEKETNKTTVLVINIGTALAFVIILMAIIFIFRDNEARLIAEESVKKSEDRLKIAIKGSKIGVWDWDIVNNILVWDDRMYSLYGIKKEDFAGAYEAWQAGLHPDDRARSHEEIQKALHDEKEFDTEFRVVWSDKSIHYIKASGLINRDPDGKPIRMIGMNWDITEPNMLKEELFKLSTFDELTGLYNRRGFKFLVEQRMKEAARSKQSIVLFLIDLDQMKKINDQFGHNVGDVAIKDTAKLLKRSFRETDIISRWGGDEFVVLGVDTSEKDVPAIKQRLEADIKEYNSTTSKSFKLSMSVGEFIINHDTQNSLDEIILEADKRMYQQKKASRGHLQP
jgi:diguanylate cyclase (GGDEF)-like protein/PAS domain S-box-containing protein